jgi:hypothetical protein
MCEVHTYFALFIPANCITYFRVCPKDRRNSETAIVVPILNHMLNLGRPSSVCVT